MSTETTTLDRLWQTLGLDSLPPDAGTGEDLGSTRIPDWEEATVRHDALPLPPTTERIDLPKISLTPPTANAEEKQAIHRDLVVTGLLGEGGMGRVLLAHQASLGRFSGRVDPITVGPPNPARLLRWAPGQAQASAVPISDVTGPVGAVSGFAFAHGGALGTDLYVSTVDDPAYTPDASVGLWRVDAGLQARRLNQTPVILDLAASPDPIGTWGDFLYGSAIAADGGGVLVRFDATGTSQEVARNMGSYGSLAFGPDGALYFSDIRGHAIHRVTACAP